MIFPSEPSDSNETELILKSQQGDEEAFAELVKRYRRKIMTICFQIIGDKELAEDAMQETFISAFRHLPSFKMHARFYTWLYRIAVNLSINILRKKKIQTLKTFTSDFNLLAETKQTAFETKSHILEELEFKEIHEIIENGLKMLSWQQQEVLRLFDIEGLSHNEIAELMHIKPGTVRSRLYYARQKMREYISSQLSAKFRNE